MKRIAIIGAGISGLFIANLFKKNSNYQVTVYEKNKSIDMQEGYGIQLSVNSVKLLNKIGFSSLQEEDKFTPEKIDFYSSNIAKICELNISDFNTPECKYTTLKRSVLISLLKNGLPNNLIKTDFSISKIDQKNEYTKVFFENNEIIECDYLIISDGVFSKSKSLISNNQNKPRYSNTLAIRGILTKAPENISNKNISLFFDSNFHHVIYPLNESGYFNFIAIMKHQLTIEEQNNYSLFTENTFIEKIINKIPKNKKKIFKNLKEVKFFPVFISENFCKLKNKNIHLIGDAFFAFSPTFAQGASQSIEGAYELFKSIENNAESSFLQNRVKKIKMVNNRSKFNQFIFHLSNPLTAFLRNLFLKRLVKNKKFLESYLGKIYRD